MGLNKNKNLVLIFIVAALLALLFHLHDEMTLFQLGTWKTGLTNNFWIGYMVVGVVLCLLGLHYSSVLFLIAAPLFLTLFVKSLVFLFVGVLIGFSIELSSVIVLGMIVCILFYIVVSDRFYLKRASWYFILITFNMLPIAYQISYDIYSDSKSACEQEGDACNWEPLTYTNGLID